jgi:hypothetical protein
MHKKTADVIPASEFRELHASLARVHSALQLREAALQSAVSRLARTLQQIELHDRRAQRLAEQSTSLLVQEHRALASQLDDVLAQARQIRGLQPQQLKSEAKQNAVEARRGAKAATAATDLSARKAAKDAPPPAKQYARERNAVAKHKAGTAAARQARQQPKQIVVAAAQQAQRPSDASAANEVSAGTELPPHPLRSVLQRATALTQDARWRLKHSAEEAATSQRLRSSTTSLDSTFALLQKQAALVCCSEDSTEDEAGNGQQMRPAERREQEQALLEQSLREFEALLAEVKGLDDPPSCGFTQVLPPAVQLRIIQLWYDVNRSLQALQFPSSRREQGSPNMLDAALTLPFPWAAQLDVQALFALDDETLLSEVDSFYRALDASIRSQTSEFVGKNLMRHVVRGLRSCAEAEAAGIKTDAHAWKAPLHWYRTLCECLEDSHSPIAFTPRHRVGPRSR